jgi:uncharacterized protein YjlB
VEIHQTTLKRNGFFPNNAHLPVLLYKQALQLPGEKPEETVQQIFEENNWGNTWVNGIYSYHHYHSNTHEVIGIISGQCSVILGGEHGTVYELTKGDVLIIPAGIAHKSIYTSDDFICVGGYPGGKDYDINYGRADEHPRVDINIKQVPIPETDPIQGREGILFEYWKEKVPNN